MSARYLSADLHAVVLPLILLAIAHGLERVQGLCSPYQVQRSVGFCHRKHRHRVTVVYTFNWNDDVDRDVISPLVSDRNVELNTSQVLVYSTEEDRFVRDSSQSRLLFASNDPHSRGITRIFRHGIARIKRAVGHSFLPEGVNPSYYSFIRWRIMQRFIDSNLHVLGTQSLIMGLGIKSSSTLGVSAALTWVLKDALGKLTRLIWASRMGRRFDSDAKRWRFRSSLVYALGNYLEIVTYINPALFLLWATAANSCKQIAMLTSSATRSALYNSFRDGKRENIADITAKGEAQVAIVDLIGISCGVSLSKVLGTSVRNVLSAYVVLQMIEIFFLFQEVRSVEFKVLNFERMAQVIESFCDEIQASDTEDEGGHITNATMSAIGANGSSTVLHGSSRKRDATSRHFRRSLNKQGQQLVPSPKDIAMTERIFLPPKHLQRRALAFGSLGRARLNPFELSRLLQIFSRDRFILIVGENVKNPRGRIRVFTTTSAEDKIQQNCHIVLHEEATNLDILKSTLALFILRRELIKNGRGPNVRSSDCWDLMKEVRQETDRLFPLLLKQLSLEGWASPSRYMFGRVQQRAYWPLSGGNSKSKLTPTTS
jgi:hypothetical protein